MKEYQTQEWMMPSDSNDFDKLFATFQEDIATKEAENDEFNNALGIWEVLSRRQARNWQKMEAWLSL